MTSGEAAARIRRDLDAYDQRLAREGLPPLSEQDIPHDNRASRATYWLTVASEGDSEAWAVAARECLAGFMAACRVEAGRPHTGSEQPA